MPVRKKSPKPVPLTPRERKALDRILRVDQAGEYGARRIYAGQLAVLKRRRLPAAALKKIEHMADQEAAHLAAFDRLIAENQTRPSLLQPLWHVMGFALGAGSALLGEKAAHACTVAVEEVIDRHYARQEKGLAHHPALQKLVRRFREEENGHKDAALQAGAADAPAYPLLKKLIATGSRAAIWVAERV